jgi:hypothetical protein
MIKTGGSECTGHNTTDIHTPTDCTQSSVERKKVWQLLCFNKAFSCLKVNILDKNTKEKKKFLSAVINLVVKTNSNKFPDNVEVNVKRDPTKSFFNLFWRGIEEGLKKTLISKKIEQKEEKIKKTVEKVKEIKNKVEEDKATFKKKMNDRFKK